MANVELGTGYVSIIPSAKGISGKISKELGGPEMERAAADAGESSAKKFGGTFAKGIKLASIAAAGAIGIGLKIGITDALNRGATTDQLAANLGLSESESARLGSVAGDLYTNAYGDSFEDVTDQLAGTLRTFGTGISDAEAFGLTAGAIDISSAFDVDPERLAQTTGVVLRTGIADSAEESQDVVAKALQAINAPAGDVLDTLYEFAEPLESLGLTGAAAIGVLSNAADAGVFDLTKAGDAVKEFSIRAIDGSTGTTAAYRALGLDADALASSIAAGGPTAQQAFSQVVQALGSIEDPLARDAAGVALFGTTWEDLGPQAIASLDPMNAKIGEVEGTTAALGDTLNDNLKTRLEELKRKGLEKLTTFAEERLLPWLEKAIAYFESEEWENLKDDMSNLADTIGDVLQPVWDTFVAGLELAWDWGDKIYTWFKDTPGAAEGLAVALGVLIGALAIYAVTATIAAVASLAVYWPILALAVVLGLLTAAFIWAYEEVDWFRIAVDTMVIAAKVAWEFFKDDLLPILEKIAGFLVDTFIPDFETLETQFGAVKDAVSDFVDGVKTGFETVKTKLTELKDDAEDRIDDIKGFFTGLVDEIKELPGKIATAASGMFDALRDEALSIFNKIAALWNDGPGSLGFTIPSWVPKLGGNRFSIPDIPILHNGGIVPGPAGTDVLALLEAGETVTPAGQSAGWTVNIGEVKDGRDLFDQIDRRARLAML